MARENAEMKIQKPKHHWKRTEFILGKLHRIIFIGLYKLTLRYVHMCNHYPDQNGKYF